MKCGRGWFSACRLTPLIVAATFVLALLTGCATSDAGTRVSAGAGGTPPSISAQSASSADPSLVAAVGLQPCPTSNDAAASDAGLPDLTLPCLGEGPAVRLAGLRGEPTLINVWASWCGPCRAELPILQRAHAAGLRVLGVDLLDHPDPALDTLHAIEVTFPSVQDPQGELRDALGLVATPATLFVDADGQVVHLKLGAFGSDAELASLAAQYLDVELP